ncbi:MAG TPA: hypothetical protein VFY19_10700 [Geminicoccaceae bacterium]|nr:hypothetical protein [Geminicoccaceae bacterium]
MPDREEVYRSIYGAYRLAFLDPSGMAYFNLSVDGFWRSFFAAVLVAPGYVLLVAQKLTAQPDVLDLGWAILVQTLAYGLIWAAFPVIALVLTQLLGLSRNYVPLIVAVNWAAVLQLGVLLAAMALGLLVPALEGLVLLVVTGGLLFYQWFVIRTALQTTGGIALLMVLVDLVLNTTINLSVDRLM